DVTITEHEANENAERIMDGYLSTGPSWDEHGSAAFYRPSSDHITLPPRETFTSADGFYSTAFHEMVHSTGHESRLNRLTPPTLRSRSTRPTRTLSGSWMDTSAPGRRGMNMAAQLSTVRRVITSHSPRVRRLRVRTGFIPRPFTRWCTPPATNLG